MKQFTNILFVSMAVLYFMSCQSQNQKTFADSAANENAGYQIADSTYGLSDIQSSKRKMIHKASLECRVDNALQAASALEALTNKWGGIVETSTYSSFSSSVTQIPYSKDSLREVNIYQPTAFLQLRIPKQYRDSLLAVFPALAIHIYSRNLEQTDATFGFVENDFKQKVASEAGELAMQKSKKTQEVLAAGEYAEKNVDKTIKNLMINDQVNFSTVTVQLQQPAITEAYTIVNTNLATKIPLGKAIGSSFSTGVSITRSLFLFLISCWPFLLLMGLVFTVIKTKAAANLFTKNPTSHI